ncbi:MAG: hypothetical protein WBP72_10295 [Rhodocyclaceae bacterium]|jgi:hypothetical protein
MASLEIIKEEGVSAVGSDVGHRHKWIEDVPEDIAPCEFACRKPHCRELHWGSCDKRRQACFGLNLMLEQ